LYASWLTHFNPAFLRIAVVIGAGFFLGGFLGAKLATSLSKAMSEKVFGIAPLLIAINNDYGEIRTR
jgi:uncharacterized membrane protein YfcA